MKKLLFFLYSKIFNSKNKLNLRYIFTYINDTTNEQYNSLKKTYELILNDNNIILGKHINEEKLLEIEEVISSYKTKTEFKDYYLLNSFPEILTRKDKNKIIKQFHEDPLNHHKGMNETFRKLKEFYKWKGYRTDTDSYVGKCLPCQSNKICRQNTEAPQIITQTPNNFNDLIYMDTIQWRTIQGSLDILTVQDALTKYSQAYILHTKSGNSIVKTLTNAWFRHLGIPKRIHTDNGTEFCNVSFQAITNQFNIKHTTNTIYHPKSNPDERFNATLKESLRAQGEKTSI